MTFGYDGFPSTLITRGRGWPTDRNAFWKKRLAAAASRLVDKRKLIDPLANAYADLEDQIKEALEHHRGNHSVISTALNALLLYPDRPYGLGDLIGTEYDPELGQRVPFVIAATEDLDQETIYAKERSSSNT